MEDRRKPFTKFENLTLVKILQSHKILLSRRTDHSTNTLKNYAWKSIAREFNSTPGVSPKHFQQLRKRWDNIKNEAKRSKEKMMLDGIWMNEKGDENPIDWTEQVENIVPHLFMLPVKDEYDDKSYFKQTHERGDRNDSFLPSYSENELQSQPPTTSTDIFSLPTSTRHTPYLINNGSPDKSEYSFTPDQRNEIHDLRVNEAKLRIEKLKREMEMAEEIHSLSVRRLNMLFACKF